MKKLILCIALVLISVVAIVGCSCDAGLRSYSDAYYNNVYSVVIECDGELLEISNIVKYELVEDCDVVYLYTSDGCVLVTSIENVFIFAGRTFNE